MMIFLFFVILLVVGILLDVIGKKTRIDWMGIFGSIMSVVGGAFVLVLGFAILINNSDPEAQLAKVQAQREVLVYQLETDMYDNDNDIGKRELMVEITQFNSDVAYGKLTQDNFWAGAFIPDIYDQIELIELK